MRLLYVAALLLCAAQTTFPQSSDIPATYVSAPFSSGEILRYHVRWKFIRLGYFTVRQDIQTGATSPRFLVRMSARSVTGLPFIDIRMRNQALLDPDNPHCISFSMQTEHEPAALTRYTYDSGKQLLSMELRANGKIVEKQSVKVLRRVFDSAGMFMLLRGLAGSGEHITIPLLLDFDIVESRVRCSHAVELVEVPAFENEVPSFRTLVRSSWVNNSVGNLGGNIDVWYTADGAGIPLRVEADIALGSIVIELVDINRCGWRQPSQAEFQKRSLSNKGGAQ